MYACAMPTPVTPAPQSFDPAPDSAPGPASGPGADRRRAGGLVPPLPPRLFADDDDALSERQITLRGPKARRLNRVLRLRHGDPLEVVHPPSGRVYGLRIERSTPEAVTAEIAASRPIAPLPPPRVVLCPSMIRANRFDLAVEKATEIGAAAIQPVWSERSQAGREGGRLGRWRRLATEAAEQCRRDVRPELLDPVDARAVITAPAEAGEARLLASALEPDRRVSDALCTDRAPRELAEVRILIGPEGGFSPDEAELARANGWQPVTLAARPLRAETAAIVALALVEEALAGLGRR